MERLTYFDGGKWRLKIGDTEYSGEAVDRLAAYEDTGLKPDEIKVLQEYHDLHTADDAEASRRLIELAQADREGRCVVLDDITVREIPAADVALVRHGRWVRPHWRNSVSCANCSECGAEAHHAEYRGVQKYYRRCPNCGARMDKEDKHEAG